MYNYNYNPYMNGMNNMNAQPQYYQPRPQPTQGLQGKSVDSLEAVKAADIAFDRDYKLFSVH